MDNYFISWNAERVGVTRAEYLASQNDVEFVGAEPVDFKQGMYTGTVIRGVDLPPLPTIEELPPLPPESNPFHYDMWNMGCEVSGAWLAMFNQHSGLKQEHNKTEEEKGKRVWNKDPEYLIFCNQRTGQRFKISFPTEESSTCRHCKLTIVKGRDGVWNGSGEVLSQYCYVDPEHGSRLHEPDPEHGVNDAVGKT